MKLDFVLEFGVFLFCSCFLSVFFIGWRIKLKLGCVACICVLRAVFGHNIAAPIAASHFSLGSRSCFLCVKMWVFAECVPSQRVSGGISVQQSLCWVFQSMFLVTSSEIVHYNSCDRLQCRCTTCISQDVLKNCHSCASLLSCSERIRQDVRIYQQGSCCHCSRVETTRGPAHGINLYPVRSSFDFSEYMRFLLSAPCQPLHVIELESLGKKLNGHEETGLSKLL